MSKIRKIQSKLLTTLRYSMVVSGTLFFALIILALTSVPFWARYSLAKAKVIDTTDVNSIVVMGGGGFPSESLMMRLWYTVDVANKYANADIVITTPGKTTDSTSTVCQMRQYLIHAGIDSTRILLENKGLNTRHQALEVKKMLDSNRIQEPVMIVSSPTHVFRSVLCFEKVGFNKVCAQPAMEVMLETDLRLKSNELGGKYLVPDSGRSISLRYKFWDYLKYEVEVIREYIALVYYKLQGWI